MNNFHRINRRTLIKTGAAAIAMPALLNANSAGAQAKVIKIGHVSPKTGPLAGFGEADPFILDQVRGILGKGLQSGGGFDECAAIDETLLGHRSLPPQLLGRHGRACPGHPRLTFASS